MQHDHFVQHKLKTICYERPQRPSPQLIKYQLHRSRSFNHIHHFFFLHFFLFSITDARLFTWHKHYQHLIFSLIKLLYNAYYMVLFIFLQRFTQFIKKTNSICYKLSYVLEVWSQKMKVSFKDLIYLLKSSFFYYF